MADHTGGVNPPSDNKKDTRNQPQQSEQNKTPEFFEKKQGETLRRRRRRHRRKKLTNLQAEIKKTEIKKTSQSSRLARTEKPSQAIGPFKPFPKSVLKSSSRKLPESFPGSRSKKTTGSFLSTPAKPLASEPTQSSQPVEPSVLEFSPVDLLPEPTSVEPTSVEPTSVEPTSVEPTSVEPIESAVPETVAEPIESLPSEPEPSKPSFEPHITHWGIPLVSSETLEPPEEAEASSGEQLLVEHQPAGYQPHEIFPPSLQQPVSSEPTLEALPPSVQSEPLSPTEPSDSILPSESLQPPELPVSSQPFQAEPSFSQPAFGPAPSWMEPVKEQASSLSPASPAQTSEPFQQPSFPPTESVFPPEPSFSPAESSPALPDFVEPSQPYDSSESAPESKSAESVGPVPSGFQADVEVIEPRPYHGEQTSSLREDFYPSEKKSFEQLSSHKEVLMEEKDVGEKKSFLQAAGAFSAGVKEIAFKLFGPVVSFFGSGILKTCLMLLLVAALLYLGYFFQIYQSVYQFTLDKLYPPESPEIKVEIDEDALNEWGINTALLSGSNWGSVNDILPIAIKNAYYFGTLAEPKVEGETGITPAYYFGLLEDLKAQTNAFMSYIDNLRKVRELYRIDVYEMLDQTTDRARKLLDYLKQMGEYRESTNVLLSEISAQVDDIKISYNSLTEERTRFEQDFFVALQSLAPEKSDFLLKSFIDVSQKQSTLKARLGALQKIATYYVTALNRLDIRIQAVDRNKEALIAGIRVVNIPGADLDIIIPGVP